MQKSYTLANLNYVLKPTNRHVSDESSQVFPSACCPKKPQIESDVESKIMTKTEEKKNG